MGTWTKNSRGQRESYFPDIGEIVSYPRSGGGVGIATRCNGVLYDLVTLNGSDSPTGVWDLQPATQAEKDRLRAALDLSRVPLDRTFQNTLPCGAIGHREFLRAAKARLRRKIFGAAA
ncbi:hypothetical protein CKO28_03165 [Rhodovibrio sodomensis]|uniref:Uncharacterized protein n=1 Tax=Rhodovibrio sodomensis TaxID=1088 RepID=A0ABS1D9E8_9PROT|nr:hypothetical protein [Rhodovibrio sodomensis]MBK1667044.1 hypothetical protein [Rhodovibrio sodomensis]